MVRPLLIVALVALMLATGVAGASPADPVRIPMTVADDAESEPGNVVVERGDHLWKISANHLEQHAPGEIVAPYWRRVVDANTPRLRSGDPNLIYPGEVIELPAVTEQR